jgi:hypothetical protein
MQDETAPRRPFPVRAALAVFSAIVTAGVLAYDGLAALLSPVLRPVWRWLAGLALFRSLGDWIGRQRPHVVLVLLGVPFVVIEPAKGLAVLWAAVGHPVEGIVLLIVAEVLSLLVCERIFHAGYGPLMRIGWFRRLVGWLTGLRDAALGWVRATAAWQAMRAAWAAVRQFVAATLPGRRP